MIRIGTSGFSYDDWKGHFYPRSVKRADMLSYYAGVFPTVEINTTYFGLPGPGVMAQMVRKVPPGFDFSVKANREMTHSGRFQPEVFAQFRETVAPLRDEAMLGCVLAQFPWSFKATPENRGYLEALREALEGMPVVVEFRNADWIEAPTFALLRSLGLGFCCVDEPRLRGLVPPVSTATSSIGYVRFHGRNAEKWWNHKEALERYNYLYSTPELEEWTAPITQLSAQTQTTYVYFNNHFEGKAGQNARLLAELLKVDLPSPPQGLLEL